MRTYVLYIFGISNQNNMTHAYNHSRDIKGKTRYTFTNTETGEVISGVFMYECDEDGTFIRTDNCPADWEGADFGVHPFGLVSLGGVFSYTKSNA